MIKARAGELVIFGLSALNLERLREGRPIKIEMSELGLPGTVLIFYGETEEKMREDMAELIGPDTVFLDKSKR